MPLDPVSVGTNELGDALLAPPSVSRDALGGQGLTPAIV